MVNELTVVELYGANNDGDKRRYTCASGTAITKGTLLTLTDNRTAIAASGTSGALCAGIAAMDKANNDNSTSISAWTNGIFKAVASQAIVVGNPLKVISNADNLNTVGSSATPLHSASGAAVIGYALETAGTGTTFEMRLRL